MIGNDFFVLHKFPLPSTFFLLPCPTDIPASLRIVLLLQVVPKRTTMSQKRGLQINSCF